MTMRKTPRQRLATMTTPMSNRTEPRSMQRAASCLVSWLCGELRLLGALMAVSVACCGALRAWAAPPQLKTPAERIVQGTVVKDGAPADNAVVYLQDTKTMVIRSYVANNGGHFHFNQLSPDTDYAVWAEENKHRSKTKTVSMFSSHLKFTYTLKIKG